MVASIVHIMIGFEIASSERRLTSGLLLNGFLCVGHVKQFKEQNITYYDRERVFM
jgi:hypothetical protein